MSVESRLDNHAANVNSAETFGSWARSHALEYLLLVACAGLAAGVFFNGFFLDGMANRMPLGIAACALLLIALFTASYSHKSLPLGIAAFVVIAGVLVSVSLAFSLGTNLYEDAEGNYLYFAVVVVVVSLASFLLTRTRAGSIVWFLVCSLGCSIIQAFYQSGKVALSIAAIALALVLVLYRNFRAGLESVDAAAKGSEAARVGTSFAAVAVVGATALVLWFAVIAPLNPGVVKITLITDYRQLPIVQLRGVSDEQPELDMSMTSDELVDGTVYTTDDFYENVSDYLVNAQEALEQIAASGSADEGSGNSSGSEGGVDEDSLDQQYDAQAYSRNFPVLIAVLTGILLLAALIAALFMLRRWRRCKRLEQMLQQPPERQVDSLYLFLLSRLERLGISVQPGTTLLEFADSSSVHMSTITHTTKVPFSILTDTYVRNAYGTTTITEDDILPFVAFYLAFWKAARKYLGNVRYFFKSFRL